MSMENKRNAAKPERDRPWLIRTYAGHSSAQASNALYRQNLAKGQTGLSVAFDLPTQTGYDSDHVLARGEVGKVGVPVSHLGDMMTLFDGIPLDQMNTSMTINAPAAWLLSLYIAVAEKQGTARASLQGTTQNDIIKEYLSRGTYIFPPAPSLKLITDVAAFTYREVPKWNPMNVCSYHLQEAGATAEQELAYALATAIAVLDAVRDSGQVPEEDFAKVVGRISFFVNAGIRFVTEICKMRAFCELWDEITRDRYGIEDAKYRRFRYGVQVNSLGLTEQQPENNVYRILIEMLAVVLSKNARARAVQLPAWNEALGLPRPWDQQWSLRLQQIMAYETDLLEYEDLFDGNPAIERKVGALKEGARAELAKIDEMGGAIAAVDRGYMKQELVRSNALRLADIESGLTKVIGVNAFTETEPSPLTSGEKSILTVDDMAEQDQIEKLKGWRSERNQSEVDATLTDLKSAASEGRNIMESSIACAHAGVTTGEWSETLRDVFGEYRAPTGITSMIVTGDAENLQDLRKRVDEVSDKLGERMKMLVGKPGLDGHSNGAEQIAVKAGEAGIEVLYEGIRWTPEELVRNAIEDGAHVIGLSILSGSHVPLVREVVNGLRAQGAGHIPVVVGGIIPEADMLVLRQMGVSAVYTPKDYQLAKVISEIVDLVDRKSSDKPAVSSNGAGDAHGDAALY
ncbi:protein meaA [Thalassospira tepidiphila]|uniref:Protein meaA n=2 Tax=Thalassospira tepidiphila TaxID=393657 RepID=A0A853L4M4_9PROT|nr:protein meaA [Thalassospira tepidiphila]NJB73749.1 (2R)-ethylmalonyl-CoA mutase [Thalassospira tepidiphila]OAZ12074.1 protein meaA [Thalassospira tepidiphila MCCC 1A03514]